METKIKLSLFLQKDMKKIRSVIVIFLCLFFCYGNAQVSYGGIPPSFKGINHEYNVFDLPSLNNENERIRADSISNEFANCTDCLNKKPSYYGRGMEISINILEESYYQEVGDSVKLWKLMLRSETAVGMQFYFEKFYLPEGAELYIYSADSTMLLGAFTDLNNNPDETQLIPFGTQPIKGNEIIFEIEYKRPFPEAEWEPLDLVLTNTIHIFDYFLTASNADYGTSLPCNIDVRCALGNGWEQEINSVALILGYDENNELAAQCSGAVLNNTDKRPYLLTAYHCIMPHPSQTTPAQLQRYNSNNWTFLFNHQRRSCNNTTSSFSGDSFFGSNRLSPLGSSNNNQPPSDYLLLDIWSANEAIFAQKEICYAGWNRSNSNVGPYIGIHHPNGDVKKISKFSANLLSTDFYGHINNTTKTHWKVSSWTQGTTERGSSGSPLYDKNHRVIGQLHGGDAACNQEPDWYGKFSSSWADGNFVLWLDPTNTGVTTMNTYCPTSTSGGGGGTGGGSGGGASTCYGIISNSNFLVNGNISNDVNVCINSPIVLEMPNSSTGNVCYFPVAKSERTRSLFNPGACNDLRNVDYYAYSESWSKCTIKYKQLFVSIIEVDVNNTPIGPEIAEWIYFDRKTNYFDPHNNSTNPEKLKSFDLKEFSPYNYVFLPNRRYRLKLAHLETITYLNGVFFPKFWHEQVKYLNTYSTSLHLNNFNVNTSITANDISFKNLIVSNSYVRASNKIEIFENTVLSTNTSYVVDASVVCLSPPSHRIRNHDINNLIIMIL